MLKSTFVSSISVHVPIKVSSLFQSQIHLKIHQQNKNSVKRPNVFNPAFQLQWLPNSDNCYARHHGCQGGNFSAPQGWLSLEGLWKHCKQSPWNRSSPSQLAMLFAAFVSSTVPAPLAPSSLSPKRHEPPESGSESFNHPRGPVLLRQLHPISFGPATDKLHKGELAKDGIVSQPGIWTEGLLIINLSLLEKCISNTVVFTSVKSAVD